MAATYQTLTVPEEQIRILELEGGSESDPIICRTFVVSLAEKPSCTALSYCWGESEAYQHSITSMKFPPLE